MPGRRASLLALLVAIPILALVAASAGGVAWANGAFPDAQAVLLPIDQPQRIIVAANFGLVLSDDDGQHWQYACESEATTSGRLYTLGPAPDNRLFSLSDHGTVTSADGGCTWIVGGGVFSGGLVLDYFPDPVNPGRVLTVAEAPGAAGLRLPAAVFESLDGGINYGPPLFTAPAGGGITGVEIAASDPAVVYLTTFVVDPADSLPHSRLMRSADGGARWVTVDLEPMLGPSRVSIAAVDASDANRIYLRASGTSAEQRSVDSIVVSRDGGQTFTKPLNLTGGTLMTFIARRDGTILVSGLLGATVVGYRSVDAGVTFSPWRPGLHPRGFGERGTTLFVTADSAADGFALASSEDNGDTWTPRLRFAEIQAVKACVYQACVLDCQRLKSLALFSPSVCTDASDAGTHPEGSSDGAGKTGKAVGCAGCSSAAGSGSGDLAALTVALLLVLARRRGRAGQGRISLMLAVLIAVCAARPALGYVRSKTAAGVPYRWETPCISIDVHLAQLPGVTADEMRAAMLGAARAWSAETNACTDLTIAVSFADGPGPASGNDGVSVIGARSDGWCAGATAAPTAGPESSACNSPSALAATSVFASSDGRILGADTQLNTLTFSWAALDDQVQPEEQPRDRQDLQSTLTHELGHLIGLEHPCWSGVGPRASDDHGDPVVDCYGAPDAILQDTMFPLIEPGDTGRRVLSPDAQRALCEIYPASGAAPAADPAGVCAAPTTPNPGTSGCRLAPAPASGTFLVLPFALSLFAVRGRRRRTSVGRAAG